MELLTKSGTYTPYEPDCESLAYLEVYRLSEDEMREIEDGSSGHFAKIEILDYGAQISSSGDYAQINSFLLFKRKKNAVVYSEEQNANFEPNITKISLEEAKKLFGNYEYEII